MNHFRNMTTKIKLFTAALALVGPLAIASTPMGKPQSDDSGDSEHFHHEYYSHSYVDPNYRGEQEPLAKANTPKKIHHGGKSDTGVSIALGGHRHRPK